MKQVFSGAIAHIVPLTKEVDAATLATLTDEELAQMLHRGLKEEDSWVFKVNPDFIVRQIGDEWMLVPTGEFAQHFNGMISQNEFSHFIWNQFTEPRSIGEVMKAVHAEFEEDIRDMDMEARHQIEDFVLMGLIIRNE